MQPVAITENYDGLRYFTGVQVGVTELESVTSCMSSKRSNQLSYTPERCFRLSALAIGYKWPLGRRLLPTRPNPG